MFELILSDIINLIPDNFRDGKLSSGNIYKIVKVFIEEINKDMNLLEDVYDLSILNNQTGKTLDLTGADFGLKRGNLSDEDFIHQIEVFRARYVLGNDIESILMLFRALTELPAPDIRIIEKYLSTFENPRPRAFDLIIDGIDNFSAQLFLPILQAAKAAGIDVTIDELSVNNFITQGNGDYLLQGNGDKLIIEPGNLPPP